METAKLANQTIGLPYYGKSKIFLIQPEKDTLVCPAGLNTCVYFMISSF